MINSLERAALEPLNFSKLERYLLDCCVFNGRSYVGSHRLHLCSINVVVKYGKYISKSKSFEVSIKSPSFLRSFLCLRTIN